MDVLEQVRQIAEPHAARQGIEIIDIAFRRIGGQTVLRLIVDTDAGITLGECEKLNTCLSDELDAAGIINARYTLEIASPGLDRPLKADRDFDRAVGKEILVTTFDLIDGARKHEGRLVSADTAAITLECGGQQRPIPRSAIARAVRKICFKE